MSLGTVSEMLVLVRPAMLEDYNTMTRQLEELQHLMNSFPVWAMSVKIVSVSCLLIFML